METTLHRQLKELYGIAEADREVCIDGYRIDAVADDLLIEVQVASLANSQAFSLTIGKMMYALMM